MNWGQHSQGGVGRVTKDEWDLSSPLPSWRTTCSTVEAQRQVGVGPETSKNRVSESFPCKGEKDL